MLQVNDYINLIQSLDMQDVNKSIAKKVVEKLTDPISELRKLNELNNELLSTYNSITTENKPSFDIWIKQYTQQLKSLKEIVR